MKIYVTRDSVSAADDLHAPHLLETKVSNDSVEAAITHVLSLGYLPRISGGRATWSVASGQFIAIVAQEWEKPEFVNQVAIKLKGCEVQDGKLRLHYNYHAQEDPSCVMRVLRGIRLTVI